MHLLNSLKCPSCGEMFPLFIPFSNRIRRGVFSNPDVKCENCGQICRARISWKNAIWSWPLTFALLAAVIFLFRNLPLLRSLRHDNLLLYVLLAGPLSGSIIGLGARRGFVLIGAEEAELARYSRRWIRRGISIACTVAFWAFLGFYTNRWGAIFAMATISLIISTLFFLNTNKGD